MIGELTLPDEIAVQKALWLFEHPVRESSTGKHWNKKWRYAAERNQKLQKIASQYRESEIKRKAAIVARRQKALQPKARKLDEEDKRFTRIFEEKFEDKHYYGVRLPRQL